MVPSRAGKPLVSSSPVGPLSFHDPMYALLSHLHTSHSFATTGMIIDRSAGDDVWTPDDMEMASVPKCCDSCGVACLWNEVCAPGSPLICSCCCEKVTVVPRMWYCVPCYCQIQDPRCYVWGIVKFPCCGCWTWNGLTWNYGNGAGCLAGTLLSLIKLGVVLWLVISAAMGLDL